jgi:drug/metabolite transporter (DMT)-like permease
MTSWNSLRYRRLVTKQRSHTTCNSSQYCAGHDFAHDFVTLCQRHGNHPPLLCVIFIVRGSVEMNRTSGLSQSPREGRPSLTKRDLRTIAKDDQNDDDREDNGSRRDNGIRLANVHSWLIVGQIFFGLGSLIMALGLPASNPFAFALYREIAAGALLLGAAAVLTTTTAGGEDVALSTTSKGYNHERSRYDHRPPSSSVSTSVSSRIRGLSFLFTPLGTDFGRFCLLGLVMYGNQAGVIAGIKLAGPVAAAVWQPSQPVMTAAISMLAGWEVPNRRRIAGVLLAFVGCAVMVILSTGRGNSNGGSTAMGTTIIPSYGPRTGSVRNEILVGNFLFFINCLCTSLYVILSKKLLLVHPPLVVTAWTYNLAAVFMSATAFLTSLSTETMAFLCPDCTGTWTIPPRAIPALAYAVLFNSVAAYGILTWANRHVTGTLVMIYTVLQPVTAALLTGLLVQVLRVYPNCQDVSQLNYSTGGSGSDTSGPGCLDPPGWGTLVGMCGVVMGLCLVVGTEPRSSQQAIAAAPAGDSRGSAYERVGPPPMDDDADSRPHRQEGLELT